MFLKKKCPNCGAKNPKTRQLAGPVVHRWLCCSTLAVKRPR